MRTAKRTIVYVDGFNLYYGCLKNTPWKWRDLASLSKGALHSNHEIVAARHFQTSLDRNTVYTSEQGHRAFCLCTVKPVHRTHSRNCMRVLPSAKILLDVLVFLCVKRANPPCGFGFRVQGLLREALAFFWRTAMRQSSMWRGSTFITAA